MSQNNIRFSLTGESGDKKQGNNNIKSEKGKDEIGKDEKTKKEKVKDQKPVDDRIKDEKSKEVKTKEEKSKDDKTNIEKVKDDKIKPEEAKGKDEKEPILQVIAKKEPTSKSNAVLITDKSATSIEKKSMEIIKIDHRK